MAHSIVTKDGIEVELPDDVESNDQRVKDFVKSVRDAGLGAGKYVFGQALPGAGAPPAGARSDLGASPAQPSATPNAPPEKASGAHLFPRSWQEVGQDIQNIGTDMGVAARGVVKGIVSPVTAVFDPLYTLIGMIPGAENLGTPSQGLDLLLTKLGVPEPENARQKILEVYTNGLASGGATVLAGKALAGTGAALASNAGTVAGAGEAMAANPIAQMAGGGAGMAAQEAAKQAGAPVPLQLAAGLAGGAAGGSLRTPGMVRAEAADAAEGAAAASAKVGTLVRSAANGNVNARRQLAEMAAINEEAKAAANRLGIELPADVFSDNPQVRSAAGITRALAGSDAESAWRTTVANAVAKADETIQNFDALFVEGRPSPGVVSDRVRNSIVTTRDKLKQDAGALYDEVRREVPLSTPAETVHVRMYLEQRIEDLGGLENLTSVEKKLWNVLMGKKGPTYGFWQDEKQRVGADVFAKTDPYPDAADMVKRGIYEAITEDQTDTIRRAGSPELQEKMNQANLLWAKKKQLDDRLVDAYGPELMGDIANKMRTAIVDSSKGGALAFNKLMETVPPELRKEAIATALSSVTRSGRGAEAGGFGMSEWAKMYPNLRANSPVYKQIVDTLGPQSDQIMRDLYTVAARVTRARALAESDASRDAAMMGAMTADSVVQKIMGNALVRGGIQAGATAKGGPLGAAAASVVANAIANGGKNRLVKAGDLFRSPKFQELMVKLGSKGSLDDADVSRVANSPEFIAFAKEAQIEDRFKWLLGAVAAQSSKEDQ